jgi:hypothetical protein
MGLFDIAKKIGGAITNPVGTAAGLLGAPKDVQNALNPVGAIANEALDQASAGLGGLTGGGGKTVAPTDFSQGLPAQMLGNAQQLQNQAGSTAGGLLGSASARPYSATNVASTSGGGQQLQSGYTVPAGSRSAAPPAPGLLTAAQLPNTRFDLNIGPGQLPNQQASGALASGAPNPRAMAQQAPQGQAPGAFQIGAGGAPVAGQIGARPSVGPAPSNVAGQLGGGYTPQNVGSISGQLGGVYSPGNVSGVAGQLGAAPGSFSMGAAPGAVAGQLGTGPGSFQMGAGPGGINDQRSGFGQTNAAQGEMLSRLSQFLDAPEGPSIAEAQLQQSQADNMASLIGAAHSGRGGAGATAEAMRGALSEGGAVMADTAGQMATLRAQEEDMRKNRQLSGIGLGGQMSEAQRAGDLTFGAQELAALQGDQATALGTRGQDLSANIANQQNALNVRGQNLSALQGDQSTALGARGQDLSGNIANQQAALTGRGQNLAALQGDQSTSLGMEQLRGQLSLGARGQDLSALTADQSTALGLEGLRTNASLTGRGQDLAALQGDQSTQLGYQGLAAQTALAGRGQDLSALQGDQSASLAGRGQDLTALMSDADRQMAANQLNLQRELGLTGAGLNAMGLEQQAAGLGQNYYLGQQNANANMQAALNGAPPGLLQQMAPGAGAALMTMALSDETAKTDIGESVADLERHLEVSPGKTYRYKPGMRNEDPSVQHAGPMAQDLAKSPFGKSLVNRGPDGLLQVNTGRLALVDHAAIAQQHREVKGMKRELASLRRFIEEAA